MFATEIDIQAIPSDSHRSGVSSIQQASNSNLTNRTPTKRIGNHSPSHSINTASKSTFSAQPSSLLPSRPKVIFHHVHETDYTLESHLRNIIKPKPQNIEKLREIQLKKDMISYLQNTKLESPLKNKTVKDTFFSKSERNKRSEERQDQFQKTLKNLFRSQASTSCSNTKNSNQKSTQLYTTLKNDSIILPDDQSTQSHLSQFSCITPSKPVFNEKVDYWGYEGFYDQFEFSQPSMKRGVMRSRMNPRNLNMNNSAFLDSKRIRNGSIIAQKQQQMNVQKLAKPVSNETKILKQHILHPKIDHILEKYSFSKAAPSKRSGSLNESTLANNIDLNDLSKRFLQSQLKNSDQIDKMSRIRRKVHKMIRQENEIYSPHKIPEYREFKQDFYELDNKNIKKAFNNFRDYKQVEHDTFYNVKAKNPYFKVYTDGQQKLVNKYLEQSDLDERFFYQFDHDPFINDPVTYEIFDIVGNSYMKNVPPHPFQHKRRYAKNEQQLEREINKTQQIYLTSIRENTDQNEQISSQLDSPLSLRACSSYVN